MLISTHRYITVLLLIGMACCFSMGATAKPKAPPAPVVPATRTITTTLKPERPKRVVDLFYLDGNNRSCVDTYKVEASKVYIHTHQAISFTSYIQRKCAGKFINAPIPKSVTFTARNINGKSGSANQTIQPTASTFSFSHTFEKSGTYQINIVHHVDDVESHTVSFTVSVMP